MSKRFIFVGMAGLVVVISGLVFSILRPPRPAGSDQSSTQVSRSSSWPLVYAGAYNGPLFAVSEKVGNDLNGSLSDYMQRNGVTNTVRYFRYEASDLYYEDGESYGDDSADAFDLPAIVSTAQAYGNNLVGFLSTGLGDKEEGALAGDYLTRTYERSYANLEKKAPGLIKGIGELGIYTWNIPHNAPGVLSLLDFAAEKGLYVMIHPAADKLSEFEYLLKRYPSIKFIMHLSFQDFGKSRAQVLSLLQTYKHLYYTIDVDHLLYDEQAKLGLLYKYKGVNLKKVVNLFVNDYQSNWERMLRRDVDLYGAMVKAVPDQILWGTDMYHSYTYEQAVYNRVVEFGRRFIGSFDAETQEKMGYTNAKTLFGL